MTVPLVLFYAFAVLAVVSALGMVLNVRNTVAGAMSLVVTMVALAGIYVLMEAHRLRVAYDDPHIAEIHLADAIENLVRRSRESLSEDRSPKNPY